MTPQEYRKQQFEEEKRTNREKAPNLAALVDELREQFPGMKLIYGKDLVTGAEVGKKDEPDPSKVFTIPPDYYPTRPVSKKIRKDTP